MYFTRTFHTVGQGAFYSETIDHFRMVYDCGSLTLDASLLKKRVNSDLGDDTDIDLLFISHFDADHVNGVRFLNPYIVILPFLSKEQIFILKIYNQAFSEYYDIELAEHPERVFPDAHIIWVMPDGFEANYNPNDERPVYREDTLNLFDIDSGRVLPHSILSNTKLRVDQIWEYIPFNPNWDMYSASFRKKVEKDLDWGKLTTMPNGAYVKKYQSTLQQIYNNFRPNNPHSLIVYSNSIDSMHVCVSNFCRSWIQYPWVYIDEFPAGCIYWGDITIKNTWLSKFLNNLTTERTDRVGMIQVPHHGSHRSNGQRLLGNTLLEHRPLACIISAEEESRYGHPSVSLMQELEKKGGLVAVVTESISSLLAFHGRC